MTKGELAERRDTGNRMSDFSSRGPALSDWNFLKPDVTAPGINILAGHTPDVANGLKGELFQYLSGTSQAAPETAGVAALLKEAHPDWSPAALKSASPGPFRINNALSFIRHTLATIPVVESNRCRRSAQLRMTNVGA